MNFFLCCINTSQLKLVQCNMHTKKRKKAPLMHHRSSEYYARGEQGRGTSEVRASEWRARGEREASRGEREASEEVWRRHHAGSKKNKTEWTRTMAYLMGLQIHETITNKKTMPSRLHNNPIFSSKASTKMKS